MMNRQVGKHLAFAMIGAAVVAELLAVTAIAASSDSASLWTAEPLHQFHFAAIAAYNTVIDYAGQLFASFDVKSVGNAATSWIADLLTVKFQLNGSQVEVAFFVR